MKKTAQESSQKGESGAKKAKEPSMISKVYLILYNGGQTLGWVDNNNLRH